MQAIRVACLVVRVERLQLLLHLGQRGFVEKLAEIGAAQDLLELRLIDGKGLGAALGEGGVAIVDVVRDVRK